MSKVITVILVIAGFALTSCKNSDDAASKPSAAMVGTWADSAFVAAYNSNVNVNNCPGLVVSYENGVKYVHADFYQIASDGTVSVTPREQFSKANERMEYLGTTDSDGKVSVDSIYQQNLFQDEQIHNPGATFNNVQINIDLLSEDNAQFSYAFTGPGLSTSSSREYEKVTDVWADGFMVAMRKCLALP